MSLHSPSVLVTPPMRATQALDEQDATLEALMEDYIRATELQKSLKKRIEAVIKEKEERVKDEEEVARVALKQAEEKTARLMEANRTLKEKMRRVEGIVGDEKPTVPVTPQPTMAPQNVVEPDTLKEYGSPYTAPKPFAFGGFGSAVRATESVPMPLGATAMPEQEEAIVKKKGKKKAKKEPKYEATFAWFGTPGPIENEFYDVAVEPAPADEFTSWFVEQ
ncbi:hypothetical protein FRC17_000125 [Serendipita sp. 399]|nr:hypothetical protein FRC17_000125 [Serendipita sp. 399]